MRPAPRAKHDPAFVRDWIQLPTPKTSATAEAWSKKGHFCKSLPTRFRRDGFDYRQIYREGDYAIYQQTWNSEGHSPAFEIIRIRRRESFHIGSRFVEPGEIYPKLEAWGTDGWTVQDRDAAFRKLREVTMSYKRNRPIQEPDRCLGAVELRGDVNDRRNE